ncbi:hypothetical protein ACQ33O_09390 [Ferruginibacter sp. SUN002]|uniref:hypothetical protein n=1 Tax=Ferruginibacter sp. SUN002 TaxID=2937789 RepID=UPI003D36B23F
MKNCILFILLLVFFCSSLFAQVKIGAPGAPVSSAVLELSSTDKGLLIPQMTNAERDLIVSPATGLMIYQTDNTAGFYYYSGTKWYSFSPASDIALPLYKYQSEQSATLLSLTNTSDKGVEGAIQGISDSKDDNATAITGILSSNSPGAFSSAIRGINNGTGSTGIGVWGSQAGGGWGVYASSNSGSGLYATSVSGPAGSFFINTNTNASNAIEATTNGLGGAGNFSNTNSSNTNANVFKVSTNGSGNNLNSQLGNASFFTVNNTLSVGAAVRAEIDSKWGNYGAAAVIGIAKGTGGYAGYFHADNPASTSAALTAVSEGTGDGVAAFAANSGDALEGRVSGTGSGIYAWVPTNGLGRAARFNIYNENNTNNVLSATTVGLGDAGNFFVNNTNGTSAAVRGEINSQYSNYGTAAIMGISSGTGGSAGYFEISNASSPRPTLHAVNNGTGEAVVASATGSGNCFEASNYGTGYALYGWLPTTSNGKVCRLYNINSSNTNVVLSVESRSSGNLAIFKSGSPSPLNVARIDATGKIFANGGFQASGADVAEYFEVEGAKVNYETGDVLVISQTSNRKIEKSSSAYSSLVAGVYATKPGLTLTENNSTDGDFETLVPMGVLGVIPTKVCTEGGEIKRGDILVTSSISGVAMKADISKVLSWQIIGKALEEYSDKGIKKINVLVNVK